MLCSGRFSGVLGYTNGCISMLTLSVYRLVIVSMLSLDMMGSVCVRGGTLSMSRMIFFCVRMSGCMYTFLLLSVPHTDTEPISNGKMCVK